MSGAEEANMPGGGATVCLMAGGVRGNRKDSAKQVAEAFERVGCRCPSVAYVGAASGDNRDFLSWVRAWFAAAGAEKTVLAPLCGARADHCEAGKAVRDADIVFVSGGDVEAGMKVLEETGFDRELRSVFASGRPMIGLSAGSIILCRQWVRWPDPLDESRFEPFPCLGIVPILCDTHGESDGWTELRALLGLCRAGTKGYGIQTGGAVVASPSGKVEALWKPLSVFGMAGGRVECLQTALPITPGI